MAPTTTSNPPQIKSRLGAILRATSGNFLEQFDFFLFGFYASYIAKAFFPSQDETAALLNTFGVFWLGALMRPVGAIVLGAYIDRIGRRKGLIVTLAIMAAGTVTIAVCPTYASIGVAAPAIVLIGRLLQGFSAGVELGGVSVYLSEIATPGNKGFYTSFQSASQQVAIFVAAIIGFILSEMMPAETVADWGWRIPFFIGCLIIPFHFLSAADVGRDAGIPGHEEASDGIRRCSLLPRRTGSIVMLGMMMAAMTTDDILFRHRLHADLRQDRAETLDAGRAAGDADGRGHQLHLESGRRRLVGPHRPQAGAADDRVPVAGDRLSCAALARRRIPHSARCWPSN